MDDLLTAMIDAAMAEMSNIHPPLRRSECERLIRAAITRRVPAAQPPERYEAVGQFISSDGKGRAWAKVAKEYENDPDTVTLYRKLPAGVPPIQGGAQ